jgi:8-oxo-dGTP diphosphatase
MIQVVSGILRCDQTVRMRLRPPHARRLNLWELPGGKVEAGETHEVALAASVSVALGVNVGRGA